MAQLFHFQLYIQPREQKTCPLESVYPNVPSSVIHNNQKEGTTQMSIHR